MRGLGKGWSGARCAIEGKARNGQADRCEIDDGVAVGGSSEVSDIGQIKRLIVDALKLV